MLDANAEALGVDVRTLVANAGRALAERVAARAPEGARVLVLTGPGNNGADGLAAAALLAERGMRVRALAPFPPGGWKSGAAREAAQALAGRAPLEHEPAREALEQELARADVVVDALLGAGLAGRLRAPYDVWVAQMARHAGKVVSADVPTGFGTETTFAPSETVTFHDLKEGMGEATCGRIHVADVGIPREAALYTGPGEDLLYPHGRADQHKGEGGIVLVIGGGPYTGAPAVAGLAALRAGADLAIVLAPQRAWPVVASYSPNLVVRPLQGDELQFDDPANRVTLNAWLRKAHSVLLGPGLGLMAQTQKAVHHALERAHKEGRPVVVDADALTALTERRDLLTQNVVVTPHAKEFRNLAQQDLPSEPLARAERARQAARSLGATWLVKGPVDVVTDGERLKLNASGHPAMSVGGTGDALAGVVGAMLAKGLAPFDAARVAARLVGEAGARAARDKGWGLVATDVVEALPGVVPRTSLRQSP